MVRVRVKARVRAGVREGLPKASYFHSLLKTPSLPVSQQLHFPMARGHPADMCHRLPASVLPKHLHPLLDSLSHKALHILFPLPEHPSCPLGCIIPAHPSNPVLFFVLLAQRTLSQGLIVLTVRGSHRPWTQRSVSGFFLSSVPSGAPET